MGSPKIMACLTVDSGGATFTVSPAGAYNIRAWSEQSEQPQLTETEKDSLARTRGDWRVAVYEGEADAPGEDFFRTPPFVDSGYGRDVSGGGTFVTPSGSDPWPV